MSSTVSTDTEDFTAVLRLSDDPAAVTALFTSAAGVSRWWGPTEGDGSVGGTLVARFGGNGVNAVRVVEAGPTRVVWVPVVAEGTTPTWHTPEWLGTTLEWEVLPDGAGTELRFRHSGLTPRLECWDDCSTGWTYFLSSIEALVDTGTGTPFEA